MHQSCEIILDSIVGGERITTIRVEVWRSLWPEWMSYRACARNSASNRAIPFKKLHDRVVLEPFIPAFIGKEHKGMSPTDFFEGDEYTAIQEEILKKARDDAAWCKRMHDKYNVAKSYLNRHLEVHSTNNALITGSGAHWQHLINQRSKRDTEPNMRDLVINELADLYDHSVPVYREAHIPYVTEEEQSAQTVLTQANLSAARSARMSYTPFGEPDMNMLHDLERAQRLLTDGHLSCFEHQVFSIAKSVEVFPNSLPGKNAISENVVTYREMIEGEF